MNVTLTPQAKFLAMSADDDLPPISETFERFQHLISGQIFAFIKMKHQQYSVKKDYDHLASDAYLGFCQAYKSYQKRGNRPITGNGAWHFGGWLKFAVWHSLLEFDRRRFKRSVIAENATDATSPKAKDSILDEVPQNESFDVDECFAEASDDAKHAVAFICASNGNSNPKSKMHKLADHLMEIGWSGPRILACFAEVRKTLGDE